jgi:hypothetical protein
MHRFAQVSRNGGLIYRGMDSEGHMSWEYPDGKIFPIKTDSISWLEKFLII